MGVVAVSVDGREGGREGEAKRKAVRPLKGHLRSQPPSSFLLSISLFPISFGIIVVHGQKREINRFRLLPPFQLPRLCRQSQSLKFAKVHFMRAMAFYVPFIFIVSFNEVME